MSPRAKQTLLLLPRSKLSCTDAARPRCLPQCSITIKPSTCMPKCRAGAVPDVATCTDTASHRRHGMGMHRGVPVCVALPAVAAVPLPVRVQRTEHSLPMPPMAVVAVVGKPSRSRVKPSARNGGNRAQPSTRSAARSAASAARERRLREAHAAARQRLALRIHHPHGEARAQAQQAQRPEGVLAHAPQCLAVAQNWVALSRGAQRRVVVRAHAPAHAAALALVQQRRQRQHVDGRLHGEGDEEGVPREGQVHEQRHHHGEHDVDRVVVAG